MNRLARLLGIWTLAAVAIYGATQLLLADTQITPGAGTTVFNFTCFTTKTCPAAVTIDPNGTVIGVPNSPIITKVDGGTQPVSGTVDLASGAKVIDNQGAGNDGSSPWNVQIRQGASTATVTNGSLSVTCSNCSGSGGGGGGSVTQGTVPWVVSQATTSNPWTTNLSGRNAGNTATNLAVVDDNKRLTTSATIMNTVVPISGHVDFNSIAQPVALSAPTTGGCTPGHLISAATTNATNIKNAGGTLCALSAINTTTTTVYLRLYNLATAPTCSSATGVVFNFPVQANTVGPGFALPLGAYGSAFPTGIGFCLTGAGTDTDNSAAVANVYINYAFK